MKRPSVRSGAFDVDLPELVEGGRGSIFSSPGIIRPFRPCRHLVHTKNVSFPLPCEDVMGSTGPSDDLPHQRPMDSGSPIRGSHLGSFTSGYRHGSIRGLVDEESPEGGEKS